MTQPDSQSFFHQILDSELNAVFDAHIRAVYALSTTVTLPKTSSIKSFTDCEYHTFHISTRNTAGSNNDEITTIVYCFDRNTTVAPSTLSLGAVHLSGSATALRHLSLPRGIQLSWTGKEIVEVLGEPERKGGGASATTIAMTSTSGIWLAWDTLGVQVELMAMDWDSPNALIREITIYKPQMAVAALNK
ncbi:hypothetical protein BDF19DRAFT_416452 [Syncephalis fuscata]|nr:hypothetical protein BDF19DRAFT_416452 [Syncephalis fuscata]